MAPILCVFYFVVASGVLGKFPCPSPYQLILFLFKISIFFPKMLKFLPVTYYVMGCLRLSSYNAVVSVRSMEVMSTVALSMAVVGAVVGVNTFLHRHATAPRSSIDAVRLAARIAIPRTSLPPPVVDPFEFAELPGPALLVGVDGQLEPLSQTTWFDAGAEGLLVVPLEEWEELAGVAGEGAVVVNLGVEEEASGVLVNLIVIGVEDGAGVGAVEGVVGGAVEGVSVVDVVFWRQQMCAVDLQITLWQNVGFLLLLLLEGNKIWRKGGVAVFVCVCLAVVVAVVYVAVSVAVVGGVSNREARS